MAQQWRGWVLAGIALSMYLAGGLSIIAGLITIGFMGAQDLWGLGEARGLGYMAFFLGIIFSVAGVLIMRIMRNRQW